MRVLFNVIPAIAAAMTVVGAFAQSALSDSAAASNSSTMDMGTMPLVAPLIIQSGSFVNTLTLVSNSEEGMRVKVAVRDASGTGVIESTARIGAHSRVQLNLTELIQAKIGNATFTGSVLLSSTNMNFASLAAQLSISREEDPDPLYLEEEFAMLSMNSNNMFRTVVTGAAGPPLVALTSLSESRQTVSVTCMVEGKTANTHAIALWGNETALVRVCGDRGMPKTPYEETFQSESFPSPRSLGISVSSSGMPGTIAVYGLAPTNTPEGTRLVALPFRQTAATYSSSAAYVGIPVGRSDLTGEAYFQPEAAVTNFGTRPTDVSVNYTTVSDNRAKSTRILSLRVPAQTTTTLVLPTLAGDRHLRNSFVIAADAKSGDFSSIIRSVSLDYPAQSVDLTAKDSRQRENGGEHPWLVDKNTTSTLLLFNPDAKIPREVNLIVDSESAEWTKRYVIGPLDTESIDIKGIIAEKGEGSAQHGKPNDTGSGIVTWINPVAGGIVGRLLESNPERGLARNFSCGTKTVLCRVAINANPLYIQESATAKTGVTGYGCSVPVTENSCSGGWSNTVIVGKSWLWRSQDTSITSIQGSAVTSEATFVGNSAGNTGIQCTITDSYNCTATGVASAYVDAQVPDHFWVNTDTQGPINTCSAGTVGRIRTIQYGIQDVKNHFLTFPIGLLETFASESNGGKNTCTNQTVPTTDFCTSSDVHGDPTGFFTDTIATGCAAPQNGCGFTFKGQVWSWCSGYGNTGPPTPLPIAKVGDIVATQTVITVAGTQHLVQGTIITH